MQLNTIQDLVSFLIKAKDAYYNGEPIVSDEEFDYLESALKQQDPNNSYFSSVGSPVKGKDKIRHSFKMRSLKNGRTVKDVKKWIKNSFDLFGYPLDIIEEPKIDGISASILYHNGKLQYVATRGNGFEGSDITYVSDYIADIPKSVPFDRQFEVRGEIYLPKDSNYSNGDENQSLRNVASGLVHRKKDREDIKNLRFVAYELFGIPVRTEEEKIKTLDNIVPNVISYNRITDGNSLVFSYNRYIKDIRDKLNFSIDGIVLKVNNTALQQALEDNNINHPKWAFAWKFPPEMRKTRLIDVEWSVGAKGKITPIAIFEPVSIGGTKIQRASLGSKRKFLLLQLERGNEILVSRVNDVLPHVEANLTKQIRNE